MARHDETGFTLLEVLIVMVLIGVLAAVVAPSFFSINKPSVRHEAQRLARVLRLAADESTLSGRALRWTATDKGYYFERLQADGEWRKLDEAPYAPRDWPAGIRVLDAAPAPEDKGVLARYVLRPGVPPVSLHLVLGLARDEGGQQALNIEPNGLALRVSLAGS